MDDVSGVAVYTDRIPASDAAVERAPTREEMSELLAGVAAASHSARGRLKALAHVVRVLRHCPWVVGTLRIELEAERDGEGEGEGATLVHVLADDGGRRERALPSAVLDVPLAQLRAVIRSNPDLFAPLQVSDGAAESAREDVDTLVFAAGR